jgi:hypothetical protein
MTAVPLNLAFQCKWCNEEDLWLGHNCRRCGSKTGKCRAPKWERIRATVTSADNPAFTTQVVFTGAASQCCGIGGPSNPNNPFPMNGTDYFTNPFGQTGVRCRYRFYSEDSYDYRKFCPQPFPDPAIITPLYSITSCRHWIYNLHWNYWSRLDGVQIYLSRLADDECKYRVTLRVSGVHLLAHTFQYLNPNPPNNCAGQYFLNGVFIGTKDVTITNASTCQPAPCAFLPNVNCAMPDFLPVVSPSVINLPSQSSFVYWMTKDVDDLTDETLSFNRLTDTALQHCNVYPANTVPTIPSTACPTPVDREFDRETTWGFAGDCEGCQLQQQYAGGFEVSEIESFAYSYLQAIWDSWKDRKSVV